MDKKTHLKIGLIDIVLYYCSLSKLWVGSKDGRQSGDYVRILRVHDVEPQEREHPNEGRGGIWTPSHATAGSGGGGVSDPNVGFGQANEDGFASKLVFGEFQQLNQTVEKTPDLRGRERILALEIMKKMAMVKAVEMRCCSPSLPLLRSGSAVGRQSGNDERLAAQDGVPDDFQRSREWNGEPNRHRHVTTTTNCITGGDGSCLGDGAGRRWHLVQSAANAGETEPRVIIAENKIRRKKMVTSLVVVIKSSHPHQW